MPAHTHGRGTTEITGQWGGSTPSSFRGCSGAVKQGDDYSSNISDGTNNSGRWRFKLQASSGWSGVSQSIGSGTAHGHSWTGTQVTIDHMNPYSVAYCYKRIS